MTEAYKMDDRPIAEIERETLANLRAAEFVERKSGRGFQIEYGHLVGDVSFGCGAMTWSLLGMGIGGSECIDHEDFDASAAMLEAYGRHKVREALRRVARQAIASLAQRHEPPPPPIFGKEWITS